MEQAIFSKSRNVKIWKKLTTKHSNKVVETRTKSGKISKYFEKNQITFDELSHEVLKCAPLIMALQIYEL